MDSYYSQRSPGSLLRQWARTGRNVDNHRFDIDDAYYARWSGKRAVRLAREFLALHGCEIRDCDREAVVEEIRHYARQAVSLALAAVGERREDWPVS